MTWIETPLQKGMAALAVPAPSIIQIGCISVKKAGFFAFFLRFYFLFLLQGKKPFPLRPAAHQPQPVRSPSKRAKTQTPRQARRKRYCFGSLIPTTPFCHNKTGELPFLQQHFFFFSNNRHKNVSFAPKRRKNQRPAQKRKANRIAAIGFSPWVCATKKIPAKNENSGFGISLFSFLHSDFLSFTSGCPVWVKAHDSEKTA